MARQSIIPFTSSQYFIGNTRDQYITPATQAVLKHDSGDSFTVGARVKLFKKQATGNNDNHCLVSALNYGSNLGYAVYLGTNSSQLVFISGNTTYGSSNGLITWGKWHTVVFRVSGTTLTGFVDGVLVWTQTIARVGATAGNAYFGDEGPGTGATARRIMGFANDFFSVRSALTDQQIADLSLRGSWPTVDVRYPLNDVSGSSAADFSGNGNNGTITGSTWSTTELFGKTRVAASNRRVIQDMKASLFFGGSGKVALTQAASLPLYSSNTAYSILAFVKLNNNMGAQVNTIYGDGSTAGTSPFFYINIGNADRSVNFLIRDDSATTLKSYGAATKLKPNAWNTIAFTDNNGTVKMYINGVEDANSAAGLMNYTRSGVFTMNTSSWGASARNVTSFYLNGSLSNCRLYRTALTASQITQAFNGIEPDSVNRVGMYSFQDGAGSVAYDSSGNGNNGTITSATFVSDVPSRKRKLVGGNLIYNGDFEHAPPSATRVAQTSGGGNWIEGSATGSSTNRIFGWQIASKTGSGSAQFDSSVFNSGTTSLKISTTAVASQVRVTNPRDPVPFTQQPAPFLMLPNTSYTLTWYCQTTANSGSANTGAQVIFNQRSAAAGVLAQTFSTGITVTTSMTKYTMTFTTDAAVVFGNAELYVTGNDGAGTLIMDAWFDDITLVKN